MRVYIYNNSKICNTYDVKKNKTVFQKVWHNLHHIQTKILHSDWLPAMLGWNLCNAEPVNPDNMTSEEL